MHCSGVTYVMAVLMGAEILTYEQSGYVLVNDHVELEECNNSIVTVKMANFKFNRTIKAMNVTANVHKDIGNNLQTTVQAYRSASNEYRLFPARFTIDVCRALQKDDFGLRNIFQCGNFTGCPIHKGTIRFCNWLPDYGKFPPNIPPGDYMLNLNFTKGNEHVCSAKWFFKINKKVTYG